MQLCWYAGVGLAGACESRAHPILLLAFQIVWKLKADIGSLHALAAKIHTDTSTPSRCSSHTHTIDHIHTHPIVIKGICMWMRSHNTIINVINGTLRKENTHGQKDSFQLYLFIALAAHLSIALLRLPSIRYAINLCKSAPLVRSSLLMKFTQNSIKPWVRRESILCAGEMAAV